ncbi:antibiotic biosynthesis monooxygenase family protein [Sphingobium nicotianae]|uniref:Antibiotic biosynthesis monooxygenase n=1 Tax=Sphingobium nicotianae TaxID=2782607 RepID=A0A9X1D7W1_9SPHN|nr:antibiotic biosynthesis monooxygenase [Sphingobium nicotianae]MBT2185447.1 antibiotic biosynthesis monooxygenase [Sphingobium nicotianae]
MTDNEARLPPVGAIAVIFIAQRTDEDEVGYGRAAGAMDALAATQPGYLGIDSVRGADGLGITVSYWADEASAVAWRNNAEHAAIREIGRARWYARYRLIVTQAVRGYGWERGGA